MKFVIPARKGSKGVLLKNRKLIDSTLSQLKESWKKDTIITSDDPYILSKYKRFTCLERSPELSSDTASMKDVLADVIEKFDIVDEDIILLYLTYPERSRNDIDEIYKFYKENNLKSLLCKKEVKTHPYMCLREIENGGKLVVDHNLYRRQDYPKCFEFCHFICIFNSGMISKLNNLLLCDETYFYGIEEKIDIDETEDLKKWLTKDYTQMN
jgi:CMP-N-acetylneuraminic acid synthetase